MKRYTNLEITAAVLGLIFIIVGAMMIFHPLSMTIVPQGGRFNAILGQGQSVFLSTTDTRFCGGFCVLMGLCICWFAFYGGRKK